MPRSMLVAVLVVLLTECGTFAAPDRFVPASYAAGALPATPALYPPRAVGSGTVLVEVTIDSADVLTAARVVVSSPAFDAAALAAATSWSFADSHRNGNAGTTHAYLLFGFQQPVIGR